MTISLDPPARRGTDGVVERLRGRDELCLPQIAHRHAVRAAEALAQRRREAHVFLQLLAQRVRQSLAREVIVGGPQTAGGEHDVVVSQSRCKGGRDQLSVVA